MAAVFADALVIVFKELNLLNWLTCSPVDIKSAYQSLELSSGSRVEIKSKASPMLDAVNLKDCESVCVFIVTE